MAGLDVDKRTHRQFLATYEDVQFKRVNRRRAIVMQQCSLTNSRGISAQAGYFNR